MEQGQHNLKSRDQQEATESDHENRAAILEQVRMNAAQALLYVLVIWHGIANRRITVDLFVDHLDALLLTEQPSSYIQQAEILRQRGGSSISSDFAMS
jgi:hypothetical protein